jgi:hypothetical protein
MTLFDRISVFVARRLRRDQLVAAQQPHVWPSRRRTDTPPTPLQVLSDEVNERIRLAAEIADDAARFEIESYCRPETLGSRQWYDTLDISPVGTEIGAGIERALRYLDLRRGLVRHPVQRHLVRFTR